MGNNADTETFRTVLSQAAPRLSYTPEDKGKDPILRNSRHCDLEAWPELDSPVLWLGFDAETLNKSQYAGILKDNIHGVSELARLRASAKVSSRKRTRKFTTPADMGSHLIKRGNRVLKPALKYAKKHLNLAPGAQLKSKVHEDSSTSVMGCLEGAPLGLDHKVTLRVNSKKDVLVIGLGRPSTSFDATLVLSQGRPWLTSDNSMKKESKLLLRQLAYHCAMAKTRYGYIRTEKDLTVCRFSGMIFSAAACVGAAGFESQRMKDATVEIESIPSTPRDISDEKQLTPDLALWWLCMMRLWELKTGDNKQTGLQESRETAQLSQFQGQRLHVSQFDAPMPVVPNPFQTSEAAVMGNQQGNKAHGNQLDIGNMNDQGFNFGQANQMQMEWSFSNNPNVVITSAWDPTLSNAVPDNNDHDMDMEISWGVEDENAEGQA